jgi:hypothetical protein
VDCVELRFKCRIQYFETIFTCYKYGIRLSVWTYLNPIFSPPSSDFNAPPPKTKTFRILSLQDYFSSFYIPEISIGIGNSLFSIVVQFLQASWVIRLNPFFENSSQKQMLVNTSCSHLHSFCASSVSSGLATRVTLTAVSWGKLGDSITRGWTCF